MCLVVVGIRGVVQSVQEWLDRSGLAEVGQCTQCLRPRDGVVVMDPREEGVADLRAWLDRLEADWNAQLGSFQRHLEGRPPE